MALLGGIGAIIWNMIIEVLTSEAAHRKEFGDGNESGKRFRPPIHAVWKPASRLHCFRMKMRAFKMDSFFMLKEEIPPDKATIKQVVFSRFGQVCPNR